MKFKKSKNSIKKENNHPLNKLDNPSSFINPSNNIENNHPLNKLDNPSSSITPSNNIENNHPLNKLDNPSSSITPSNNIENNPPLNKLVNPSSSITPSNGINNLIIIISILSILRFLIEDYREFGWIMNIPLSEITLEDCKFFIITILFIFIRSCISYFVCPRYPFLCIGFLNILISEYFIVHMNIYKIKHIYLSGWSLILNLIFLAKIISFHILYNENNKCNKKNEHNENNKCNENNNNINNNENNINNNQNNNKYNNENNNKKILGFNNFLYFLISPTLCYQDIYILKISRNYKKIFYKFILIILGLFLFVFVTDQYSIPSIYRIKKTSDVYILCENAINLALSTALLFIIFFHLVFVCFLDILAEITLFKENEFYQAWWNSSSVAEFWTLWNIPVHNWFKKHVYIPLRKRLDVDLGNKLSKNISRAVCFFISALFHEYVLSLSTKKFSGLVFLAMMGQIPIIFISECIKKVFPRLSNYFFWCCFCIIGQPTMVFLYYRSEDIK